MPSPESADRSRWFIFPQRADADAALYCLPHAGAGATAYRDWLNALGPRVAVRPLQPPGRENRIAEPPELDVGDIADVLGEETRPYALYGHSLGALIAYETTRELQRRGLRLPERLFVAACRPPWRAGEFAGQLLALTDAELIEALVELGGTPAEIRDEPELLDFILGILRADLGWMRRYVHSNEPMLSVPVIALAGEADPQAPPELLGSWSGVTSEGFALHTVPGGHLFAQQELERVVTYVRKEWPRAE